MEWRPKEKKGEFKNNSKVYDKTYNKDNDSNNQKTFNNKSIRGKFSPDNDEKFKSKRNVFQKKRNENETRFKDYKEIDDLLNSGKYMSAKKVEDLKLLRDRLKKKYDKENPLNDDMFPSLELSSSTSPKKEVDTQKTPAQTCWGSKLPDTFYDTTVPFETKFKKKVPVQVINSDKSDDYDSYDSFDDDYYNENDDNYDDNDEGF